MSETCKYCGSIRTEEGTLFWNAFHCGTGFYGDEPDKQRQSPECKDRQLTALAQRDEQAETRIKEYRERIEELETDKAMYRDKWLNALERVIAAESREKRLREGIEALHRISRSNVAPGIDRQFVTQELAALIAQPSDGKDNPDAQ